MRSEHSEVKKIILLTIVVTILMSIPILMFLMVRKSASDAEENELKRWAKDLVDLETLPARYPEMAGNEEARELKKLTCPLGIDLGKHGDPNDIHPTKSQTASWVSFKEKQLPFRYLQKELKGKENDDVRLPDQPIDDFLVANQSNLEAIRSLLLKHDVIWPVREPFGPARSLPPLIGILDLTRLLEIQALQSASSHPRIAHENLQACWNLRQSLRYSPELLCLRFEMILDRYRMAFCRRVPGLQLELPVDLRNYDYRKNLFKSFEADVAGYRGYLETKSNFHVTDTYLHFCVADYLRCKREELLDLQRKDICALNPSTLSPMLPAPVSRWNAIGKIGWVNFYPFASQVAKLIIDRELTNLITEVRRTGIIPHGGERASSVCPGCRWLFSSGSDGSITISFKGKLNYSEKTEDLPLTFTTRPYLPHNNARVGTISLQDLSKQKRLASSSRLQIPLE